MAFLEAVVAFALAMIVFSSLVTTISEVVVNRIFKLRQQGFHQLLENIYDHVIVPRVGHYLAAARASADSGDRDTFVKTLMRNLARDQADTPKLTDAFSSRKISALTAIEFIERLAETDVGKAIAQEGKDRRDALVDHLALKFERYGDGAREYFRQRAQSFSILIAVLLALSFNIDAVRLFQGFLDKPAARERLLAQADEITAPYRASQPVPADGNTGDDEAPMAQKPQVDPEQVTQEVKKVLADIGNEVDELSDMGLAVGHYPMCSVSTAMRTEDEKRAVRGGMWTGTVKNPEAADAPSVTLIADAHDPACLAKRQALRENVQICINSKNGERSSTAKDQPFTVLVASCLDQETTAFAALAWADLGSSRFWRWVVLCVLSGLLIGLGGPFWFNVFSNLNQVLQVARAFRGALGRQKTQQAERQEIADPEGARRPKSPVETFDRAMAAAGVAAAPDETWETFRQRHRRGWRR